MKVTHAIFSAFILLQSLISCTSQPAEKITMPGIFSNNMVIQQGAPIKIWGEATPGCIVAVTLGRNNGKARADANGRWELDLPEMNAGGPFELCIAGADTIRYENVMIGEVWICSGQSNMEWPVKLAENGLKEIKQANNPAIRLLTVEKSVSLLPSDSLRTDSWAVCSPEAITGFSAVGYFFGRELNEHLNVPVGLIHVSWGGTPAEAWTPASYLNQLPDFVHEVQELSSDSVRSHFQESHNELLRWEKLRDSLMVQAMQKLAGWNMPEYIDREWNTMNLPVQWEKAGNKDLDGVVLFRQSFQLPEQMAVRNGFLSLGPIDDQDIT